MRLEGILSWHSMNVRLVDLVMIMLVKPWNEHIDGPRDLKNNGKAMKKKGRKNDSILRHYLELSSELYSMTSGVNPVSI